jgi:hypothetical protein
MKQCQDCGTIVPNFWRRILGKGYCKNCANKHIKPKSLPKISKKKEIENQEYSILRVEFLTKHPTCQAKLPGCTVMSCDVHHSRGRGKYTLDVSTWFALCRTCHVYIEMNSDVAKEYGFTKTRI